DGTVVNKTGTLSNAIACSHYRIPYHAFAISPDPSKRGEVDVLMEERNSDEMKECRGEATTVADIPARYPAFDIIAASLVTSVVTPKGVLRPHEVEEAFA
ncbi:MAG: translation initiation factor 2, partial [Sphaerochaeta sp.]